MFKFTIRELLLLTVIVGLAAGWWLDRIALSKQAREGDAWKLRAKGLAIEFENRNDISVTWDEESLILEGDSFRLTSPLNLYQNYPSD